MRTRGLDTWMEKKPSRPVSSFFAWPALIAGVGRVGLSPPFGVSPLFTRNFRSRKRNFPPHVNPPHMEPPAGCSKIRQKSMASTEGSAVMVLPGGRSGPASRHRSPCQSPTTTTASCDAGTQPPSPEAIVSGDCGAALFNPCGLTASANGEVYVADTGHHRICVLKQDGMRVLAGSG